MNESIELMGSREATVDQPKKHWLCSFAFVNSKQSLAVIASVIPFVFLTFLAIVFFNGNLKTMDSLQEEIAQLKEQLTSKQPFFTANKQSACPEIVQEARKQVQQIYYEEFTKTIQETNQSQVIPPELSVDFHQKIPTLALVDG